MPEIPVPVKEGSGEPQRLAPALTPTRLLLLFASMCA